MAYVSFTRQLLVSKIQTICASVHMSPKQKERVLDDTARLGDILFVMQKDWNAYDVHKILGLWRMDRDNIKRQTDEVIQEVLNVLENVIHRGMQDIAYHPEEVL